MGKYIRCPRCELNYILEGEEYCDVCKAELHIGNVTLLEDDEEEDILCPVCKINYVEPGEKYCLECKAKKLAKVAEDWEEEPDAVVTPDIEPDEIEIPLETLDDSWSDDELDTFDDDTDFIANDDDFADEEAEEEEIAPVDEDDFDEIDLDIEDFDDEEDEEESEDDELL